MADDKVVFKGETDLGRYEVVDTIYNHRLARVLYNSGRTAAQSGVAKDNKPELLFDYNQRFLELAHGLRPKHLLILGGGAFTLPAALMREFPELKIDIVELDRGLLGIAKQYFGFRPNQHTRVYFKDGREFIDKTSHSYDLVIMDVFDRDSIPTQFHTLEAAQSLRRCLNKDGVVAINIISSLRGLRSVVLHRLEKHLWTTFPKVDIFPASSGHSPWVSQNLVIAAQNSNRDLSPFMRYSAVSTTES